MGKEARVKLRIVRYLVDTLDQMQSVHMVLWHLLRQHFAPLLNEGQNDPNALDVLLDHRIVRQVPYHELSLENIHRLDVLRRVVLLVRH